MAIRPPSAPGDNTDLWGIDPNTGRPYTVSDRRWALLQRGDPRGRMNVLPNALWDTWHDRNTDAIFRQTGKAPNALRFHQDPYSEPLVGLQGADAEDPSIALDALRQAAEKRFRSAVNQYRQSGGSTSVLD